MKCLSVFLLTLSLAGQTPSGVGRLHLQPSAKPPTTADMTNSANKSAVEWEKEIQKNYEELLRVLAKNPTAKASATKSQQLWVASKDSDLALIDALYAKKDGTLYIPMRANARAEIFKARALALKSRVADATD